METEPIVIPIHGDPSDFVADANRVDSSLNGVEKSAKKTSMSVTDMRSAFQLAADAARIAGEVWQNTVGTTVELANEVRKYKDITGQSAEESSRLVDVLGHYKIASTSALTATKKLSDEGHQFSIETLARLSDQYNKLGSEVEKTEFLYKTFGKSGKDFAEAMRAGGDAIREISDTVPEYLILTEKQIKAAREYEIALDEMTDSATGLKVAIGNELIPVGNVFLKLMQKQIDEGFEWQDAIAPLAFIENIQKLKEAQFEVSLSSMDMAEGMKELSSASEDTAPALDEVAVSTEDLTKANQDYLSTLGDVTKQNRDFQETEKDLQLSHIKLVEEKEKLEAAWWRDEEAIQAVNEKLADNEEAQAENVAAMEDATHRRMLAMLEEQLSIDGLSEKESTFLLEQGVKWGIYSEEAIEAMAAIQRQVDAMERNIDININVHTNYSQAGQAALTTQLAGEKDYVPKRRNATGGTYMIPESYGNEGFMMSGGDTASGGEQLKIIPKGQASGGVVVNIMLDSGTPDPERVAYNLKPAVERVIRDMQRAGTV